MASHCEQCYESDPSICPRANDCTKTCCFFAPAAFSTARTADGVYEASLRNCLPEPVRSLEAGHIDSIVGHTPTAPGAVGLTPEETAVIADYTTLDINNIHLGASIARKRPGQREAVEDRLNLLLSTTTQGNIPRVTAFLEQIREKAKETREITGKKATTGTEYKQGTYPRATLFSGIVRSVTKGMEVTEDAREMFDPSTGKKYVPFEKQTKVDCGENLVYAVHLYTTSMQTMIQEAPKVYFEFMRDVTRVSSKQGHKFGQAYVDAILRTLDEKRFPSMVAMYRAGEPTRIFLELEASGEFKAAAKLPTGGGGLGGRKYIKAFGPVTTPTGGEGAGVIKKKCMNFHASPQKPCTAGVPCDEGFAKELCGLCAYEH